MIKYIVAALRRLSQKLTARNFDMTEEQWIIYSMELQLMLARLS